MNKIYKIGHNKLTIWHADSKGQLVMTNTHEPNTDNPTPWHEVVQEILIDEGFIRHDEPGANPCCEVPLSETKDCTCFR